MEKTEWKESGGESRKEGQSGGKCLRQMVTKDVLREKRRVGVGSFALIPPTPSSFSVSFCSDASRRSSSVCTRSFQQISLGCTQIKSAFKVLFLHFNQSKICKARSLEFIYAPKSQTEKILPNLNTANP